MFSCGNGNEMWVMLVEKAYAKLHGNYWQLRAGFVAHGMMDLSGCPTRRYNFPDQRADYSAISDFAERFWDILTEGDRAGWIMCAGTPGVDVYTEGGGPDDEFGIVPGHAYSVIAANEYKNVRLLNVRNPWGQFEWGGKWSDQDRESWTPDFIQAFKPDFDEQDGSFWIEYDDFFKYFESLTVCKIENWRELRIKGKFIKAEEMSSGNETVISQFFYSLQLDTPAHIELGIHQEDERILGAERRPYIDLSLIILEREYDGTLSLVDVVEMRTVREAQKGIDFDAGHFIIVPRTTGAALQRTSNEYQPLPIKIKRGNKMRINPEVYSAIMDVFRKIDLKLDSVLSARELNYFGDVTNEPYFQNLTPESFETREFDRISCTYEGVTRFGFFQLLETYSDRRIREMLNSLGYDETLNSTKSRVFVISFHSSEDIRVRIGDATKTDLNQKAIGIMMNDYLKGGVANNAREDKNVIVFRKYHEGAYASTYAAVNKTERNMIVNLDMTASQSLIYMPQSGRVSVLVPAKSLKYLAS